MKRALLLFSVCLCLSAGAWAQPRPVDRTPAANSPITYDVRYEGGVFGASSKEKGTLKVDEVNSRVVFMRPDGREMFSMPFESLVVIYPDSKDSTPQSGKVLSKMPLPGAGLFDLMNKNTKYAILTFDDPDVEAKGTASFRFDNKGQLLNFIHRLGTGAKMIQRGDAYYRPKKSVY